MSYRKFSDKHKELLEKLIKFNTPYKIAKEHKSLAIKLLDEKYQDLVDLEELSDVIAREYPDIFKELFDKDHSILKNISGNALCNVAKEFKEIALELFNGKNQDLLNKINDSYSNDITDIAVKHPEIAKILIKDKDYMNKLSEYKIPNMVNTAELAEYMLENHYEILRNMDRTSLSIIAEENENFALELLKDEHKDLLDNINTTSRIACEHESFARELLKRDDLLSKVSRYSQSKQIIDILEAHKSITLELLEYKNSSILSKLDKKELYRLAEDKEIAKKLFDRDHQDLVNNALNNNDHESNLFRLLMNHHPELIENIASNKILWDQFKGIQIFQLNNLRDPECVYDQYQILESYDIENSTMLDEYNAISTPYLIGDMYFDELSQ